MHPHIHIRSNISVTVPWHMAVFTDALKKEVVVYPVSREAERNSLLPFENEISSGWCLRASLSFRSMRRQGTYVTSYLVPGINGEGEKKENEMRPIISARVVCCSPRDSLSKLFYTSVGTGYSSRRRGRKSNLSNDIIL